jgi:hypothetical protein
MSVSIIGLGPINTSTNNNNLEINLNETGVISKC